MIFREKEPVGGGENGEAAAAAAAAFCVSGTQLSLSLSG